MKDIFTKRSYLQSDQKGHKPRVLPHLLLYPDVCISLSRTRNYTCYALSLYWLPTHHVPKGTF
jgi:hypothetical protein